MPHGCTGRAYRRDVLICQHPDRGRREVFSGGKTWGWLISVGLMLHIAAGEKLPVLC